MDRSAVRAALATMFGLQALRAFFPSLVYVLRDRAGLSSLQLGGVALLLFATTFFIPRILDRRRNATVTCVFGLVGARLALQFWPGDPIGTLVLAAMGTLAFFAFLAAFTCHRRVAPVLVGAAADASLFALFGTRDLAWGGIGASIVTVGLAAALIATTRGDPEKPAEDAAGSAGLFAWGPYFALHLEVLGNVARASAHANLSTPAAGAWVTAGLLLGALLSSHVPRRGFWAGAPAVLLAAVFLLRGLSTTTAFGPLTIPFLWVTQSAATAALAIANFSGSSTRPRTRSAAFGWGSIAFLGLLFAHYAGYAIAFPWSRREVFLTGGLLLLAAAGLRRSRTGSTEPKRARAEWVLVGLVAVPLLRPVAFPSTRAAVREREGFRVVSFNLHNGFDERGGWAFDEMMRHLSDEGADAIALQEVSRGWIMNGGADLYELARHTLGLEGAFGASVGGDWGNAIFAHQLSGEAEAALPPGGVALPRAAISADVGPVRFVATHFHHLSGGADVRSVEATALVDFANQANEEPVVVAGDFNAVPAEECFRILERAGWTNAGAADATPTYPSREPTRRIDTILGKGNLEVRSHRVNEPWGSDHRSVTVDYAILP